MDRVVTAFPSPVVCSSSSSLLTRPNLFSPSISPPPPFNRRDHGRKATLFKQTAADAAMSLRTRTTPAARCEVASRSDSVACASISEEDEQLNKEAAAATDMIGSTVRVTAPLKVFHVPKVPELNLAGMEGRLKQYVGLWKGKHLSANLPFKVEFVTTIESRGPVKFLAHLKEDEFEFVD